MLFALSKCRLGKFIFDKSPNPHLFAISATQTVDLNPQDFVFFAIFHRNLHVSGGQQNDKRRLGGPPLFLVIGWIVLKIF